MNYKVVEMFVSINGEGRCCGELSVFVRFAGCNLDCSYCDTSWANLESTKYQILTEQEIYGYIKSTKVSNVTLTGGEPLIQDDIATLLDLLSNDPALNVEIETNGSVDINPFTTISPRLSFTLDYKVKSSHMESFMNLENYSFLKPKDTVKFVVGDLNDLIKTKSIIDQFDLGSKCNVHLSCIYGNISFAQIVDFMKDHKMNGVRLQPQLHKIIWDPNLRGV